MTVVSKSNQADAFYAESWQLNAKCLWHIFDIFCHILLLSTLIKFILNFQCTQSNFLTEEKAALHWNVGGTFLTPMQIFRPPNVRLCYAYEVGTVPFCDSWTLRNAAILNIVNFISVWQISHYNTPFYRHFRFFANQYAWLSWQEGPFFQMSYNIIRVGQWKCASR